MVKTGILVIDTNKITLKSVTSFLYKLQSSTPVRHSSQLYAPPGTTSHHQAPPGPQKCVEKQSYMHSEKKIEDESEGDPAAT